MELLVLCFCALAAGFVDSIVGGGGLIQLPALFVFLPPSEAAHFAAVMGTNKVSSICGTTVALAQYARTTSFQWPMLGPAAIAAGIFSFLGARTVSMLPRELIRPLIFGLLIAMAIYTFIRKDFGRFRRIDRSHAQQLWLGLIAGGAIGFYDGFFGPGTGSFLIFVFIGVFGFEFLQASAHAKVVNVATNVAAVAYFAASGNVLYQYAIPMAAANVVGGFLGARMAILKGSDFIRRFFLALVLVLIARFGYEIFAGRQ